MNKTLASGWRALLLWCLALLLPLQGLAAGASLRCLGAEVVAASGAQTGMLEQQPSGTTAAPAHPAAHPAAHIHPLPCHQALQPGPADNPGAAAEPDAAALAAPCADGHVASGHGCGACAACCMAAPLPAASRWKAALMPAQADDTPPAARWPHVLLAGIERPPRSATT